MARSDDRRRLALDEESERLAIAAEHRIDRDPGLGVVHIGGPASKLSGWFDGSVSVLAGLTLDQVRMA